MPGDVFSLGYDGSACTADSLEVSSLSFYCNMYGPYQGTLSVIDALGASRWSRAGPKGNNTVNEEIYGTDEWFEVSIADLHSPSFEFRYVSGSDSFGDAAVDDVSIQCGVAPPVRGGAHTPHQGY